jgi:hypothetical protein
VTDGELDLTVRSGRRSSGSFVNAHADHAACLLANSFAPCLSFGHICLTVTRKVSGLRGCSLVRTDTGHLIIWTIWTTRIWTLLKTSPCEAGGCVGCGSLPSLTVSHLNLAVLISVCGTTLMNVGLILTPVSIYQMSRGALVLWVGILSVFFLRRRLWLYQWTSLVIVTMGVCLVGLSGSLVKKELQEVPEDGVVEAFVRIARRGDDDPAKVALGVSLILFAQVFTASQYVSWLCRVVLTCRSSKRRSWLDTRSSLWLRFRWKDSSE